MLSELHNLNLKLCSKLHNKKFVLHLIVAPQLSSGRQNNYSTHNKAGRLGQWAVFVFSYVYGHYAECRKKQKYIILIIERIYF